MHPPGTALSQQDAQRLVAAFVEHCNNVRLHSAIGYIAPVDRLEGRAEAIWAARDHELTVAREARAARRGKTTAAFASSREGDSEDAEVGCQVLERS